MIDFAALRAEFIASSLSVRQLAENHKMSESTLTKRAVKEKWVEQRRNMGKKVQEKSDEKYIVDKVKELALSNRQSINLAQVSRSLVNSRLNRINQGSQQTTMAELDLMLRIGERAQKVERIALNVSTNNTAMAVGLGEQSLVIPPLEDLLEAQARLLSAF